MSDDHENDTKQAVKTLHKQRAPPDVPKVLLSEYRSELRNIMKGKTGKIGLAIVVTMNSGPCGVETDLNNVTKAFEELGFVVWKLTNASNIKITGAIKVVSQYNFFPEFKFIAFYASCHGGSVDNHAFLCTAGDLDEKGCAPRVFIEEAIISPLRPQNMPDIRKSMRRIFLLDCCLKDGTLRADQPMPEKKDMLIPPQGNVIVAYSTSMDSIARGDEDKGGVWTRFLVQNMKFDLPFTTVLDMTWEDTVEYYNTEKREELFAGEIEFQAPHYTSCTGLVWLHHPDWDKTKYQEKLESKELPPVVPETSASMPPPSGHPVMHPPQGHSVVNQPIYQYPPAQVHGMASQPIYPPQSEVVHPPQDLQLIADKIPEINDLTTPLKEYFDKWQEILLSLGVSLGKVKSIQGENHNVFMRMASGLNYWKASWCSNTGNKQKPTWQVLIDALLALELEDAVLKVEQQMRERFKHYIAAK